MKQKWYDKKWLVILLLVVFYPIGVYALWKNKDFSFPVKILLTAILVVYVSIMFVFGPGPSYKDKTASENKAKTLAALASDEDKARALAVLKNTYYIVEPNHSSSLIVGERISYYDYVKRTTAHIPEEFHYGWESRKNPIGEGILIGYGRWSTRTDNTKEMGVIWLVDKYGNVKPANFTTCMMMNMDVPDEVIIAYNHAFGCTSFLERIKD